MPPPKNGSSKIAWSLCSMLCVGIVGIGAWSWKPSNALGRDEALRLWEAQGKTNDEIKAELKGLSEKFDSLVFRMVNRSRMIEEGGGS